MSTIATIGFFDGVHRGHQYLFEHLRREAQARGLQPLIITFAQHPRAALQSDYIPQLLSSESERIALLRRQLPPDGRIRVFDFADIAALSAAEFMQLLRTEEQTEALLMGYDHRFGSDRLRWPREYQAVGQAAGIEVISLNEFVDGEWHISSTEIRQALSNGNIVVANELLGRSYALSGTVEHGNGIGRQIGFPTANIRPDEPLQILPKNGVYAVKVIISPPCREGLGVGLSICNIGSNPTVGNSAISIEVHIPGWKGDLYGKKLTILFEKFIRDEQRFRDLESLRTQIKSDILGL